MPVLPVVSFAGQILNDGKTLPVTFDASIDDDGVLQLAFEALTPPFPTQFLQLGDGAGKVIWMTLRGTAVGGESFASETFSVSTYSHRPGAIDLGGHCAEAEIITPLEKPAAKCQLWWGLRRFRSFGWLQADIGIGRVSMGGADHDPQAPQLLSATLAIVSADASEGWFGAAQERMEHVARVMSFASGTYLRPYVERRVNRQQSVITVYDRSETAEPFYPPFSFLNLGPIFGHACGQDAEAMAAFAELDPAIRWLLTPGFYDEIRLMTAITAIENLVDQAFPGNAALFVTPRKFGKLASAARKLIADFGFPQGVKNKVPELNRRTFAEKLQAYIADRNIVVADLPKQKLQDMISARNKVVHTGIYFDPQIDTQPDLWDHMLIARELATRMLLSALVFVGNYFAPYYGTNSQLRFPSCQPLADTNVGPHPGKPEQ